MSFREFNVLLQKHVKKMTKDEQYLFVVDLDKETVWNTYLDSFPEGTNNVFRERREYDCSCCRHFIRDLGRVVAIKDGEAVSIWDFDTKSTTYEPVVNALSELIRSTPIKDVFIPTELEVGTEYNIEFLNNGKTCRWYHFYAPLSRTVKTFRRDEIGTVQGRMRDIRNVFKRSLEEISMDSIDTVLDLIAQKSLYKGEEWTNVLTQFKRIQKAYLKLDDTRLMHLYTWKASTEVGGALAKIRNHSIGVLLTDISEGVGLDEAVRKYEAIVAPANYKRPKAIFTKKMLQQAQKKLEDLGYMPSLGRRYARLEDVTVPNTLFANRSAVKAMAGDVFDELASEVSVTPKNLSKVEEIAIETFVNDVLPKASEVEVLLANEHMGNMVSLIAPKDKDSKSLFKWGNNFSWAYAGNITDSMKERVKAAGGKVDGVLRFSIQWNDKNDTPDDLDAHCKEPNGYHIFFNDKLDYLTGGNLDVDIIQPKGVAVENITWPARNKMAKGTYFFFVHNYTSRGGRSGFTAEIEFDGHIYSFSHPQPLRHNTVVNVADVMFDGQKFTIREILKSQESSRDIWGLKSNQFHPVTIAMYSPNYWDGKHGIGHRHYFFMLDKCQNPESPNGFFNEFLQEGLLEHKRVFEALGSKMRVEDSEQQLSGLGFSSTKRAELVVKVKGSFDRMLKVKF